MPDRAGPGGPPTPPPRWQRRPRFPARWPGYVPSRTSVQVRPEDHLGRHLVDQLAPLGRAHAPPAKPLLGLERGEPLVPEVDGEPGMGAEPLREGPYACGLTSLAAVHVQGEAHHEPRDGVFTEQSNDGI